MRSETLAVVIPAYKERYFHAALSSLENQTCKDFNVYVGDDCSPYVLDKISRKFQDTLNLSYHRFEKNIGGKDLVSQWERCVDLIADEKWIWLFSDDDIADKCCVENFYHRLEADKGKFDVYRFNTSVIDSDGKWMSDTPKGPLEESSENMAFNLLHGRRGNSMPDHIFSRQVYQDNGGFVHTDFAQAADWGTSILFSKDKGIRIIENATLFWRYSGDNISSIASSKRKKMVRGHLQFIKWLMNHFSYLKNGKHEISFKMMRDAARANLKSVIVNHYRGLALSQYPVVALFERRVLGLGIKDITKDLLQIQKYTLPSYVMPVLKFRRSVKKLFHAIF